MATKVLVNIGSGNGLLPDGTKPFHKSMLFCHQWSFVVLTWEQFHCNCSWWRHQMETFSALLAICAGNSSVPGEFPAQRPVTRSFDVFFDLRQNKRLSKQSWGWWLRRKRAHYDVIVMSKYQFIEWVWKLHITSASPRGQWVHDFKHVSQ